MANAAVLDVNEAAKAVASCIESPHYFLDNYAQLNDPHAGIVPFRLWPFQSELLDTFETEQRVIVLKARQLGISWLVAGYALWTALFNESANVLMLSKRLDEAVGLLDKAEFIYGHLPAFLRAGLGEHNQTTLQFAKRGSKITALPATEDAGRSETASLIIVDEAAFHPHADANYAAYKPAVDAGGKLILVSTANGRGGLFHRLWTGAAQAGFRPVFLDWSLRPGRDAEWWATQEREYAATPQLLAQEYPHNATEAFISSGNCVFNTTAIATHLDSCRPPIASSDNDQFRVWQRPLVGRHYVAGADVAEGKDAGNNRLDYSVLAVYDWQTGVNVATLRCQLPPDEFARQCATICTTYGNALLGVERNNHGGTVLLMLKTLQYSNIYEHDETNDLQRKHGVARLVAGWPTTARTKPQLEAELAALIVAGGAISYDAAFWDECLSYVRDGAGHTGAQSGCHDDMVVAHMIALQMAKRYQPTGDALVVGRMKIGGGQR